MEEKKTVKRELMDYLLITVGTVIYGIGVSLFLDPNNLAPGGVTGIAMILNRLSGLSTGTGILLINIPILAVGLWKFGFRFLLSISSWQKVWPNLSASIWHRSSISMSPWKTEIRPMRNPSAR